MSDVDAAADGGVEVVGPGTGPDLPGRIRDPRTTSPSECTRITPRSPARWWTRPGKRADHPRRDHAGSGGVPDPRADAVRVGVRPRGVPRPGLHRRLPPPPGGADAASTRAAARTPRSGSARNSRRTATTRRPTRWSGPTGRAGRSGTRRSGTRRSFSTASGAGRGSGRTASPTPRNAGGSPRSSPGRPGRLGAPTRAGLFVHEQLAARAAGRKPPDQGRGRLERAVAHRTAGRDRAAAGDLRAVLRTCSAGTGWRSGGSSSFHRSRCRSPRPSGPPPGTSSRSPPCSWRRRCSAGPPHTTTPRTAASSASTSPECCPTTSPAPGTCNSPCSSCPPRSSPAASSWPP